MPAKSLVLIIHSELSFFKNAGDRNNCLGPRLKIENPTTNKNFDVSINRNALKATKETFFETLKHF